MNTTLTSVMPTRVGPSVLGWSNGVEEPALSLRRPTPCRLIAFVVALGCFLVWITSIAGAQKATGSETEAQKELDNLTTSLVNGSVASIDILHMPDSMETRASVSPENLERWWDSRITISKVREWAGRNELVEAMKSTKTAPNSRMPDLRSAVIFSDSNGQRIQALYFGRYFGRYVGQVGGAQGSIAGTPVSFKGDLPSWLKGMIPPTLR